MGEEGIILSIERQLERDDRKVSKSCVLGELGKIYINTAGSVKIMVFFNMDLSIMESQIST